MKKLKRITVFTDMSGFGKCALTVAIPIINASGIEVIPVPTALLSTNTKFPGFYMFDFTGQMEPYLNHLSGLELKSDALYSGFLSNVRQADMVQEFMEGSGGLKLVDPIMGDNGKPYRTFGPELCGRIGGLCKAADIITPNVTEAYILAGESYSDDMVGGKIRAVCERISEKGARTIIITGVERGNALYNCVYDVNGYREHEAELLPFRMSGTGDMFASLIISSAVNGLGIDEAIDKAQSFISLVMKKSAEYEDYQDRGPCFEPYLWMLGEHSPVRKA